MLSWVKNELRFLKTRLLHITVWAVLCVALLSAMAFAVAAPPGQLRPATVWTVDISKFGPEERLAAVCLQGIANRRGPRVYLNTGKSLAWMQIDSEQSGSSQPIKDAYQKLGKYTSCCDVWMEELTKRELCSFEPTTMDELIARMRDELKGVVLYRNVDDDLAVAATMCGLRDAVPLTPELYEPWVSSKGTSLPTVFDVGTLYSAYPPKLSKRLAAHTWALEHLFPECDKNGAVSRDKTYGLDEHDTLVDVDIAVQNRWITYDLDYLSSETKEASNKPDPVYGFDPPDKPILIKILGGLNPFSPVYGWGRPGEFPVIRRLTMQNCVMVCTGTANSSFYRKMPRLAASFAQPRGHGRPIRLENKVYVAFLINEGDTLKCLSSFQNQGGWLQPERGKIPINWGMDPLLYRDFPGLVSYYYATATPNDYFFAGPCGWGYIHPDALPDRSLIPFATQIRKGSAAADINCIDLWWAGGLRNRKLYFPFVKAMGVVGVSDWSDHQGVQYAPGTGTPVVQSNYYYPKSLGDPEKFASELIDNALGVKTPWFIIVYGGTPHQFYEVATRLPKDRFKVVSLDEFYTAARLARPQVEGREWKPSVAAGN